MDIMGYNQVGGGKRVMTAAMKWGADNEPKARKAYIDQRKEQGVDVW